MTNRTRNYSMQLNFTHFIKTNLWVALALTGQVVVAQVKFSTTANQGEAGLDEYIEIGYVIENAQSVGDFSPPDFKNFKVVQGPSQSQNVTVINGRMSRSVSVSYVLKPETTGKLTIEGATATIDGKNMRSENITVQINKTGNAASSSRNAQPQMPQPFMPEDFFEERDAVKEDYSLRPGEDFKEKVAKNLIVKLDVNKTTCYEGEPIIATYKLYSRLRSESRITKRPSLNGFSVYDMMNPADNRGTIEKLNGKDFNMHIIRRSQLVPLQAGSYTLDPVELENKVQFLRTNAPSASRSRNPMQRMIEAFMGRGETGEMEEHTITLRNNPVKITVKPLPQENKPADFKGAVGKFTLQAELKNKAITAGDAALLEVVIQGTGNLPVINAPDIILPAGMEAFDPVVKENTDKTVYPLKGSKTFSYTFIAHDTGSFIIPPVKFSYFDPATASYKTLSSDSFAIRVLKGNKPLKSIATAVNTGTTSAAAGWKEILSSSVIMLSLIALLLGIIIYLLIKNRNTSRKIKAAQPPVATAEPVIKEEELPAKVTAADPLQEAKMALHLGRSQEFYSEINKAMQRLATSQADTLGVETLQGMEAIRRECEIALYTPGYEEKDRQLMLEKAERLIKGIGI